MKIQIFFSQGYIEQYEGKQWNTNWRTPALAPPFPDYRPHREGGNDSPSSASPSHVLSPSGGFFRPTLSPQLAVVLSFSTWKRRRRHTASTLKQHSDSARQRRRGSRVHPSKGMTRSTLQSEGLWTGQTKGQVASLPFTHEGVVVVVLWCCSGEEWPPGEGGRGRVEFITPGGRGDPAPFHMYRARTRGEGSCQQGYSFSTVFVSLVALAPRKFLLFFLFFSPLTSSPAGRCGSAWGRVKVVRPGW